MFIGKRSDLTFGLKARVGFEVVNENVLRVQDKIRESASTVALWPVS